MLFHGVDQVLWEPALTEPADGDVRAIGDVLDCVVGCWEDLVGEGPGSVSLDSSERG